MTKKVVNLGLTTAIVCITTMIIKIPVVGTQGYINLGDSIIFITALIFGPIYGMIAGGIGSAFADIFLGYTQFAVFTLIIKSIEGLLCGYIGYNSVYINKRFTKKALFAIILAGITMVFGYFIANTILYGVLVGESFKTGVLTAVNAVLFDIFQCFANIFVVLLCKNIFKYNKFNKK